MKKIFVFLFLICAGVSLVFAQAKKSPVKKIEPPLSVKPPIVSELSDAEWKNLINDLQSENWQNSALIAAKHLETLKIDNEKKQLAQLRYFYLYGLAGKILHASAAGISLEKSALWNELDKAVGDFVGKEIIAPPRRFLPQCKAVLNYVCAVRDNEKLLRVTATNREGTRIHSFDYVLFDEKISWGEFVDKEIFLGGKLKRAEFNQDLSKSWVMRLIFENGFVKIVESDDK